MFGLTKEEYIMLESILYEYSKSILSVKIFGSRATGQYKKTSDIDLAISFRKNIISQLRDAFYESPLSYTVDIIDYDKVSESAIQKVIDRDGIIFLETDIKGKRKMLYLQLKMKLNDYNKAVVKLSEALKGDINEDDIYLDATIQRFEFTYELAWKLMKAYLEHLGILANSPRSVFREAFKIELIPDGAKWIKMVGDRNLTTHTYNQQNAVDIYNIVQKEYIKLFNEFQKKISNLVDQEQKSETR
jgi:nucleotidyltransferase substrate binding protein (TIGR01987 family)